MVFFRNNRLAWQSSWLSEALAEIDPSCERLTLRFTPRRGVGSIPANTNDGDNDEEDENEADETRSDKPSRAAFSLEAKGNTGSVQVSSSHEISARAHSPVIRLKQYMHVLRWITHSLGKYWRYASATGRYETGLSHPPPKER